VFNLIDIVKILEYTLSMERKNIIFIILVLIIVILVLIFSRKKEHNELKGSGIIEVNEVNIASKIPGRIKEIRVKEGYNVSCGDTLIIIEHKELLIQKNEANAGLLNAEQSLKEIMINKKELLKNLNRIRNLHKTGDVSDKELEAIETQYELLLIQEERAKSLIEQARARIELINTQLENAFITSPIDGVVLSKYYEPGELVNSGSPILKIGDLKTAWLKIYIMEKDLGRVHLGSKAEVFVDAYPSSVFNGEITWISSEAEFTPKNVQTREERANLVFAVKITIPNTDAKLLSGMTAEARVIEEDRR
jgi:HlyD family secretion protein